MACPVKGDLKYGFPRSNDDGSISLLAREITFIHPVKRKALQSQLIFPKVISGKHLRIIVKK